MPDIIEENYVGFFESTDLLFVGFVEGLGTEDHQDLSSL